MIGPRVRSFGAREYDWFRGFSAIKMPSSRYERAARSAGYRSIAGVDEVGRGALFGPVIAAAVVLDPARQIRGLDDSKQLDAERREVLAERIRERAVAWAVAGADAFEIDRVNILQASRLAMKRAVERSAHGFRFSVDRRGYGRSASFTESTDPWGFAELFDCGGVHTGQGGARRGAGAVGSRFSRLRFCPQ